MKQNPTAGLEGLAVFVEVVREDGFTAAAHKLGLSKSTVSKQVRALEDRLGAQLLVRTTRRVRVTDTGQAFFERAVRILDELGEAEQAVSTLQSAPAGLLRVSAPVGLGRLHLAPLLPAYRARYPEVEVELTLEDRRVDLLSEGFDLAVRISELADSTLVARRLAPTRLLVFASPDYLARRGAPRRPEELPRHDCLLYSLQPTGDVWPLVGPEGRQAAVRVRGPLRSNSGEALLEAAVGGLGLVLLPDIVAGPAWADGRLVRVLERWHGRVTAVYAVYPPGRHLSPKVRSFVDHLATHLARVPWDPGRADGRR